MLQIVKDLIDISTYAGNRTDYTQGGGGNTSVKDLEKGIMLIKASGFRLVDISETNAFVAVDQKKISKYYLNVDLSVKKDYEKESAELSKSSVLPFENVPTLRPSVEVGFHSLLKKYVIHTHSVYANILTCSKEGEGIANKIFKGKDFGFIFLPYINPGFELSLAMKKRIDEYIKENGIYPEVIFMKNHGLVVTGDSVERVKVVNTVVNEAIREYLSLEDNFRSVELVEEDGAFVSKTKIITDFISRKELSLSLLNEYPLYPDQLVYLNNIIAFDPEKLTVTKDKVMYKTDKKQATTLEETLAAYLFILTAIEKNNLTVQTMNEKEVYFINHWEAEKYRRSVK